MKNIHFIFSDWSEKQVSFLKKYGIEVEKGYFRFQIEENETYFKLKPYLEEWNVSDTVYSKFSLHEIEEAELLVFFPPWLNGYPMPSKDFNYQSITYDDSAHCPECDIKLVQKDAFRLESAPKWKAKKIFSLNWVYDEFFVEKAFFERVFKDFGLTTRPVVLHKSGAVIEDVLQLVLPEVEFNLRLDGYSYEICKRCSSKRFDLINHGFFPPFENGTPNLHLFKSREWFGTGHSARKYVFISKELRAELDKNKILTQYIPCKQEDLEGA